MSFAELSASQTKLACQKWLENRLAIIDKVREDMVTYKMTEPRDFLGYPLKPHNRTREQAIAALRDHMFNDYDWIEVAGSERAKKIRQLRDLCNRALADGAPRTGDVKVMVDAELATILANPFIYK